MGSSERKQEGEAAYKQLLRSNWGVSSTLVATNGQKVLNRLRSRTGESSDSPNDVGADTSSLGGAAVHFRIFRRIVMPSTTGSGSLLRLLSLEYEGTAIRKILGIYPSNDKASHPRTVELFLECLTLEMGPIGCPEISVGRPTSLLCVTYQKSEYLIYSPSGGSLKSSINLNLSYKAVERYEQTSK